MDKIKQYETIRSLTNEEFDLVKELWNDSKLSQIKKIGNYVNFLIISGTVVGLAVYAPAWAAIAGTIGAVGMFSGKLIQYSLGSLFFINKHKDDISEYMKKLRELTDKF